MDLSPGDEPALVHHLFPGSVSGEDMQSTTIVDKIVSKSFLKEKAVVVSTLNHILVTFKDAIALLQQTKP